jgi:hypothetical protein
LVADLAEIFDGRQSLKNKLGSVIAFVSRWNRMVFWPRLYSISEGGFNIRNEHHRCPERFTVVRWQFRDFG